MIIENRNRNMVLQKILVRRTQGGVVPGDQAKLRTLRCKAKGCDKGRQLSCAQLLGCPHMVLSRAR
eukprot:1704346-Amphidinium_carterae.1